MNSLNYYLICTASLLWFHMPAYMVFGFTVQLIHIPEPNCLYKLYKLHFMSWKFLSICWE